MSRSSWKHDIINLEKLKDLKLKINSREEIIPVQFLDSKVSIHNGKRYINTYIDKFKLGYKFGEFAFTRKRCIHKVKKKIKKTK